jgi:GNAT superfamily N-acetyltransferase
LGPLDGFEIGPLTERHQRGRFSCGHDTGAEALNTYLKKLARKQNETDTTRVHLYANNDGIIAGYYTLSPLVLELSGLPADLQRGRPSKMGVGATLLGKLAVAEEFQRRRVGEFLLFHAIKNALEARKIVSSALLVIDSKPSALGWYLKQSAGFMQMPDEPLRLLLPFNQFPAETA